MNCSSCKNLKSDDQCPNKALNGLLFCGKHAKSKNIRLWTNVHKIPEKVIKIQKVWRGYLIRNWIKECGIGCLKRSMCHNDEELVTMEHKSKQYPLDYFSFEENGKIWWFNICSITKILEDSIQPKNPYTRVPLTIETRRRLRELCIRRVKFDYDIHYTYDKSIHMSRSEFIDKNWILISQILEENGFADIHPQLLSSMSIHQYVTLLSLFLKEMKILALEHSKTGSRRHKYVIWTRRILDRLYDSMNPDIDVIKLFFTIFQDTKNPFPYCFIFASAIYKM